MILLHFHRDDLPYKKHTSERYNYSSKHDNELVAFHVPQVLQQLCDVDQYFLIIQGIIICIHCSTSIGNCADTSKKYLHRIVKSMTTHDNNKHKRGETDEEHNDSSNDDK